MALRKEDLNSRPLENGTPNSSAMHGRPGPTISPKRLPSFKPPRDLTLGLPKTLALSSKPKKKFAPNVATRRNKTNELLDVKSGEDNSRQGSRGKRGKWENRGGGRGGQRNNRVFIQTTGSVFGEGIGEATKRYHANNYHSHSRESSGGSTLTKTRLNLERHDKIDKKEEDLKLEALMSCNFVDDPSNAPDEKYRPILLPLIKERKKIKKEPQEDKIKSDGFKENNDKELVKRLYSALVLVKGLAKRIFLVYMRFNFSDCRESYLRSLDKLQKEGSIKSPSKIMAQLKVDVAHMEIKIKTEPGWEASSCLPVNNCIDDKVVVKVEPGTEEEKKSLVKPKEAAKPIFQEKGLNEYTVRELIEHSKRGYMLFQLPTCLPGPKPDIEPMGRVGKSQGNQPGTSESKAPEPMEDVSEQLQECTLSSLPEGRLGTLRIFESGRSEIFLNGGYSLVVNPGTQVGFLQELVSVDLEESNSCGKMMVLGPVCSTLNCTPDLEKMILAADDGNS